MVKRAPSVAALTDPVTLSSLLGRAIEEVRVEPLRGVGFSNAVNSRVEAMSPEGDSLRLVLKRVPLGADWIALRTGDVAGREALLLSEPSLAPVWEIVTCPYVAFAAEAGEIGLLMHDLSGLLLPDVREPLSGAQESALLGTLARLHARFWDTDAPPINGLMSPARYCDFASPSVVGDERTKSLMPTTLRDSMVRGWEVALGRVPADVAEHLSRPGAEWEEAWADLPQTLLHGDTKVANCAVFSDGRVSAFDWALVGSGPCTIDLGWYLAVNASRLTASKSEIMARYRALLEAALGRRVPDRLWGRLETVAVTCGARTLLWSKALALESGRAGAGAEWEWWVQRLGAVARSGG